MNFPWQVTLAPRSVWFHSEKPHHLENPWLVSRGRATPGLPFNNTAGETSCPLVLLVTAERRAETTRLLTSRASSHYVTLSIPSTLIRLGLCTTGYDPGGMKSFPKLKAGLKEETLLHPYVVSIWYPPGWPVNSSSCWLKGNVSFWV